MVATENTLGAMEAALRLGVDGIETDLRQTRDGTWIVFHDETAERLCGVPLVIEKADIAEIRRLRIKGEKIPLLEELLDLVRDRCLLNLEIKTIRVRTAYEKKIAASLKQHRLGDSILCSAFNPIPLIQLRWILPQVRRGFLYVEPSPLHGPFMPLIKPYSCHALFKSVSKETVARAQRNGKRFFVWTVNQESDMKEMIAWGVDGIITDHPDRLMGIVNYGRSND